MTRQAAPPQPEVSINQGPYDTDGPSWPVLFVGLGKESTAWRNGDLDALADAFLLLAHRVDEARVRFHRGDRGFGPVAAAPTWGQEERRSRHEPH